jgi:hypothetical protein
MKRVLPSLYPCLCLRETIDALANRDCPVQSPEPQGAPRRSHPLGGEGQVSFKALPFGEVFEAVEGIAQGVAGSIQKAKPCKARVELGLAVGLESRKLTDLLVKGTGTAKLELTLGWVSESSISKYV